MPATPNLMNVLMDIFNTTCTTMTMKDIESIFICLWTAIIIHRYGVKRDTRLEFFVRDSSSSFCFSAALAFLFFSAAAATAIPMLRLWVPAVFLVPRLTASFLPDGRPLGMVLLVNGGVIVLME